MIDWIDNQNSISLKIEEASLIENKPQGIGII